MLVNKEIISELYENAGDTRYQNALEYVKDKRVTITNVKYENQNNFELSANVKGDKDTYNVYAKIEEGEIKSSHLYRNTGSRVASGPPPQPEAVSVVLLCCDYKIPPQRRKLLDGF